MKHLSIILLVVLFLSACKSDKNTQGCGVKECTTSFAYLGIRITDNDGKAAKLKSFTAINLRTNKSLTPVQYPPNIDFVAGFVLLASDSNIKDFSTDGDDVKITAIDSASNQTKTSTLKISGGCNCHLNKLSGPDVMAFD
jgi:hypothetical protein